MKGKRTIALLCAAAMVLSLAACGTGEWSGQTLTGQVTEIDGSTVTLQLGEMTEGGAPGDQDGQNSQDGQPDRTGQAPSDGQTPPDRPDGDDGGTPPDLPDGQDPGSGDGQPPEKPDGAAPSDDAAGGSGDEPSAPPDGAPSGGMGGFTAGDETATLDFSSAAITKDGADVSLDDIAVGDVLTCTVGDGDAVTSAEVLSVVGAFTQGDSAYTISEDGT